MSTPNFVMKKILINENNRAILQMLETALLSAGIKKEDHQHLIPTDSQPRNINLIESAVRNGIEHISKTAYSANERALLPYKPEFENIGRDLFQLYFAEMDKVTEEAGIEFDKADKEIISNKLILIREILLRLVAQILDLRSNSVPGSDDKSKYLDALKEFTNLLRKTENLIYKEGLITSEPLFHDAVTSFARHIADINRVNGWQSYFKAAIKYKNIITKAHQTANACQSFMGNLIIKIKQFVYLELEDHIKDNDLDVSHINYKLDQVTQKYIHKKQNSRSSEKVKLILQHTHNSLTEEQAIILANIDSTESSKTDNMSKKIEKLKQLYSLLNKSQARYEIIKRLESIIVKTGWTAILLGVINLDGFRQIIHELWEESQHLLDLSPSVLKNNFGKLIIFSSTDLLIQLDETAYIACEFLNELQNQNIQQQVLDWLRKDIEFLQSMEKIVNFSLININKLPQLFRQKLNLNNSPVEYSSEPTVTREPAQSENGVMYHATRRVNNEVVTKNKHYDSFLGLMAKQLNDRFNSGFTKESLRNLCKDYMCAEDKNGEEKVKTHRKRKLQKWYNDLLVQYAIFSHSRKVDEIHNYLQIENGQGKHENERQNGSANSTLIKGHVFIEGRLLLQLSKHIKALKEFNKLYVTFVAHNTVSDNSHTQKQLTHRSYLITKNEITAVNEDLTNNPLKTSEIHLFCKEGEYQLSLDAFKEEEKIQSKLQPDTEVNKSPIVANKSEFIEFRNGKKLQGVIYQEVQKNGQCLYQVVCLYLTHKEDPEWLRRLVAAHIEHNMSEFAEFIQPPAGVTIQDYLRDIRNGIEWADHIEIEVLMRVLNRPIVIIGPDGKIRNQQDIQRFKGKPIFTFYNGHNHYDALICKNNYSEQQILGQLIQLPQQEDRINDDTLSEPIEPNRGKVIDIEDKPPSPPSRPASVIAKVGMFNTNQTDVLSKKPSVSKQLAFLLKIKDEVFHFQESGSFCRSSIPEGINDLRRELNEFNEDNAMIKLIFIIQKLAHYQNIKSEGLEFQLYKKHYTSARMMFPSIVKEVEQQEENAKHTTHSKRR